MAEIPTEEWVDLRERMATVETDVAWIRKRLNGYRPPWSVVAIILFLSSTCVGLIVKSLG